MKHLLMIVVAIMVTTSTPAMAGSSSDLDRLADLIHQTHDATAHPFGTAVAVVKGGEVVYEGYFGFQDIQRQVPVTRDTVFYIASVTKPFFALNALLKEQDGKLDTRISLQQMFPDIRFQGFDAGDVTIKDLLVHTSGVDNPPLVWATAFSGVHDASSRLRLVAASRPADGTSQGTFKYTNVGYNILSVWLDEYLGIPWQDQLDRAVFQPLDMQRTSAYISEAETKGWPLAKPYSFSSAEPNQPLYLTKADDTMQAAGGMVSTASDLAKFVGAQLLSRIPDDHPVLSKAVIEQSHLPQATLESNFLDFQRGGYAWGWYTGEYKDRKMLHHFGGFSGFHAHVSFMPEESIGLVVLNNDDFLGARLTSLIADYVYGALLEQPGIESRVGKRFDELQAKAVEFRAAARRHRQETKARAWDLSMPRDAYVGTYSNDLLGDITITLSGGQEMEVRWGRLDATASGYEQSDHVRVEFSPNSGDVLSFRVNDGSVEAALFEGMEFFKTR